MKDTERKRERERERERERKRWVGVWERFYLGVMSKV